MENTVKQVDAAFVYIIAACVVLLALITAAMIYFAIRYRSGKNPDAADIRSNLKVEIAWTAIPTVIVLIMFYFGWVSYVGLRAVPPGSIDITVTAMQFAWVFEYPNKKQSEGLLMVPQGKPIRLTMTSLDVIHGFFLPAFRVKMDVLKNMKTYTWFFADKIGTHLILCSEYCGTGHADMSATLRIVPESEYRAWLERK